MPVLLYVQHIEYSSACVLGTLLKFARIYYVILHGCVLCSSSERSRPKYRGGLLVHSIGPCRAYYQACASCAHVVTSSKLCT